MYNNFFGFRERPFKLVPNPAFLFLSRSHEEALGHLTYALSQGDGFVTITGEVGTGKTTLCRAFLETLNENTESAYIFNPKLGSIQLLSAINAEFGIDSGSDNIKDLIDTLNSFLMESKARGKKVILIIDEAHNLSNNVLEQLRLLSNLETTADKLIQIVLVGQPELGEMLDSEELRQLGQRITLSCHLTPLTPKETREYIQHRINIASHGRGIKFDRGAYGRIYKYSKGIPRLINIVCDRSLLTAFGFNRYKITGHIARASIRELSKRVDRKGPRLLLDKKKILISSALHMILFVLLFIVFVVVLRFVGISNLDRLFTASQERESEMFHAGQKHVHKTKTIDPDSKIMPDIDTSVKNRTSETEPSEALKAFFEKQGEGFSKNSALKTVMDLWDVKINDTPYFDHMEDDYNFFRLAAKQNGLSVHRIEGDLELVKGLNLPAIMECYMSESSSRRYVVLTRIDKEGILTVRDGGKDDEIQVDRQTLTSYWSGVAYIFWKNFYQYTGDIPLRSSKDSIVTLKIHLRDIGFNDIKVDHLYDETTRKAVKTIQVKHGLPVDGIVGPLTKIALYNEKGTMQIPHIVDE